MSQTEHRLVLRRPRRALVTAVFGGLVGLSCVALGRDVDVSPLVVIGAVMMLLPVTSLWPRVVVTDLHVVVRNVVPVTLASADVAAAAIEQTAAWPPADRHVLTLVGAGGVRHRCWAVQSSERTLTGV